MPVPDHRVLNVTYRAGLVVIVNNVYSIIRNKKPTTCGRTDMDGWMEGLDAINTVYINYCCQENIADMIAGLFIDASKFIDWYNLKQNPANEFSARLG